MMKHLLRLFYLSVLTCLIYSCNNPQPKHTPKANEPKVSFEIKTKTIKADTAISTSTFFNGHIICLMEDDKILALDTAFNIDKHISKKLSLIKAWDMDRKGDTVVLYNGKKFYYLDSSFNHKEYKGTLYRYWRPYFEDSTYYVYACCVGEFGGAVFFLDKKADKVYSYPASCVQQVLKYDGYYVVCSFGYSAKFEYIKDPRKLYKLPYDSQRHMCNWYVTVDSIKVSMDSEYNDRGVIGNNLTDYRNIVTFPYQNNLYTIYCRDSFTILAQHRDFRLVPIDTLLRKDIFQHWSHTFLQNGLSVTSYGAFSESGDSTNRTFEENTGLIYIRGNNITFVDFDIPDKRPSIFKHNIPDTP